MPTTLEEFRSFLAGTLFGIRLAAEGYQAAAHQRGEHESAVIIAAHMRLLADAAAQLSAEEAKTVLLLKVSE